MSDGSPGQGGRTARGEPHQSARPGFGKPAARNRAPPVIGRRRALDLVRRLRIALPVSALVLVAAFFFNTEESDLLTRRFSKNLKI